MSTAVPIIRQDGDGEQMWFAGGGVFTWKATAAETAGAFTILEDRMERNKMTPMHLHPEQDETVYVLDGDLLVDIEGEQHAVHRGGLFFAPRGVPHAFMVTSETARVLAFMVDGSGESFYRQAGRPITSPADAEQPADFGLLRQVAESSPSIELIGPPPFEPVAAASAPA
ncbi:MAG TPA: cupin domain-containing protein [Solirubrobacteraceae bacterium]|nr:cupin domain-containing protein [Solirubrobacteraceae bacterium]